MIILFVVSHAIIKDPYGTYFVFSKKKKKKKLDTFLGAHNVTKTQLDSLLGILKGVLLKQLF